MSPSPRATRESASSAISTYTHAPYYPAGLITAPFTPALFNTFAIVARPAARLAPGTRELLVELETHMHTLAEEFDRSR